MLHFEKLVGKTIRQKCNQERGENGLCAAKQQPVALLPSSGQLKSNYFSYITAANSSLLLFALSLFSTA